MNNQRIDRNDRKQIEQLNAYSFVPTEIKYLKDQKKTLDFSLTSKRKYSYLEEAQAHEERFNYLVLPSIATQSKK